ncbi:MAG: hypothetical protein R6V12_03925 [Candidatus Hydrogenedentota bacterium]
MSDKGHKSTFFHPDSGEWREERRKSGDRRKCNIPFDHEERRRGFRRQADLEITEREHKQMIEEALEEFAAEHDQERP